MTTPLIAAFLDMYEGTTKDNYLNALSPLVHWATSQGVELQDMTDKQFKDYFMSLADGRYKNNTIRHIYNVTKVFSTWMYDAGHSKRAYARAVRQVSRFLQTDQVKEPIRCFTEEQMKSFLAWLWVKAVGRSGKKYIKALALVQLGYYSYLRVSEMTNLTKDQFKDGKLRVVGKGNKVRYAPADYVMSTGSGPFIETSRSEPIRSTRRVQYLITNAMREYAKVSGDVTFNSSTPHWLRHTGISHALKNGKPLLTIRDEAGHSSLLITDRYLHNCD